MGLTGRLGVGAAAVGLAACAALGEFASDDPGLQERAGVFKGSFVAVSDADMAATAYVDGRLEPFAGMADMATLLRDGAAAGTAPASNSVVSWPQIVDAGPDGRFVYVVETRGSAPAGTERVANAYLDFPEGKWLTVLSVGAEGLAEAARLDGVGTNIQSVEAARDGRFLALGTEDEGGELVIVPLSDGLPAGEVRRIALKPPFAADDKERRIRTVHLSPDGRMIAVNVANRRVQFYRLEADASGVPAGATPVGAAVEGLGRRLAVGKWTPDGRFFVVTDTNWAESQIHMLTQGPSVLSVVAPPADGAEARIVSRAKVGRSAEGFSLSHDGRFVATINMERTYLPQLAPLAFWNGRRLYSVSLLSFDPATGALAEIDRIKQAGSLPEDVIFDATGDNLAVAVFHRRKGEDRARGFIDFFAIRGGKLESQGVTQAVMRGPHDLVAIP